MSVDERGRAEGERVRAAFERVGVPDASVVIGTRRQRRFIRMSLAGVAAVVVAAAAVAFAVVDGAGTSTTSRLQVQPTGQSFVPDPRVVNCFGLPVSRETNAAGVAVRRWPEVSSRLLVLGDDGGLWVVERGHATEWSGATSDTQHSGIVWARWLDDSSILAARVGQSDVELDRYTAPDTSVVVAHLGFTIKANAPAGSCPMNGYLATFAVVDAGVVLLLHAAGPLAHSCPPSAAPSGCVSAEGYSIEVRSPSNLEAVGQPTGDSAGGAGLGRTELASSNRPTDTIVIDSGSDNTTMTVGPGHSFCCYGGQSGTAYALSPDGRQLAYAQTPGGQHVFVADVGPNARADDVGARLWTAPNQIDAMAWTDNTLAVVEGSTVALIDESAGASVGEVTLGNAIRTIDWQHQ